MGKVGERGWCMTGTATETIVLNSLSLFTCTTVRYGQMLHENVSVLGGNVQRNPFRVKKIRSSFKNQGIHFCHCQVYLEQLVISILILQNK